MSTGKFPILGGAYSDGRWRLQARQGRHDRFLTGCREAILETLLEVNDVVLHD